MKDKFRKTIAITLMVSIIAGNFVYPTPAYARISFNRFFRSVKRITRHIGRGTRFVVRLPDKATRWMGPVLGPIASTILTKNIAKNARWGKVFKQAGRASRVYESIEEKEKYLAQLRSAYRDQANDLRKQANEIRDSRRKMLDQWRTGDITLDDYKKHVVALNDIAQVYEAAADKFDNSANKMRVEDVARIFSRDLLNQVWGQVRDAVIFETTKELNKLIDPDVVQKLITGKGVNLDTFLDGITSYQINKYLADEDTKIDVDALKERVRDRIKEILEENKEEFKKNWKEKVDEIIKNMAEELEKEKENLPDVEEEDGNEEKPDVDISEITDDKCRNGYEWNVKLGKCIQSNCYPDQIPHAHHSYVLDCVCGSSGSIDENPDDPNKECAYPASYEACPGCVYACVGLKEDCPEPPK